MNSKPPSSLSELCVPKEGPMNNLTTWEMAYASSIASSIWRTAYVSAIFEKDPGELALRISDARAAITARLNSSIGISRHDQEAIEAAQERLGILKV